ncbi:MULTISPECIES: primosomal protein N' [unclassified Nocardioides]|uniref:primosomal protein N' n=1 Tax=unclassified Nocardioides TaxID=2615069 RepID=UPI0000EB620F|nr:MULTISPECIES: primosomal protein N' [unclassified Nocardioides]ABL81945.1 primosomal protein N' (replication factor Y) (superfamily II helicase) [Nocardioides sp. JS614]
MTDSEEQPELLPGMVRASVKASRAKARATRARKAAEAEPAAVDPVARVLVDLPLAHLDRPFDYAVPAAMADDARPGARVKVRFAGQDVDGYLVARAAESEHLGRLAPLRRVVSPEPVLAPQIEALSAELAERYAGTRSDVLRLAVPPRHATTEKAPSPPVPSWGGPDPAAGEAAWAGHEPGAAFLRHLTAGGIPRAVWTAAPAADWPVMIAHAVAATYASGRGSLVCVPDHKDVARVGAALTDVLGEGRHVTLTADSGPAARYRDFLAVSRGARRVVVGTRGAAFAPVHELGLVVVWDDGDDLHAEPRAPYPHTRETLLLRAEREGAAALVGGFVRTVEGEYLLRTGWAHELVPAREEVRRRVTVSVAGDAGDRDVHARGVRMPRAIHQAIREALDDGPVLVQTPRVGYVNALACERCRTPARCAACQGPLALTGPTTPPACRWCGILAEGWACRECGFRGLRAPVLGDARTAEELGRAFPGTTVRTSSGEAVVAAVGARPQVVVATPGAEPVAEDGYAAVVLLDTWLLLSRIDLRAEEEALRRWANAAGLVRPGGRVVAVGDAAHPALQALVRWDPAGFAARETAERVEAHLPPASRLATITGEPGAVDDALILLDAPSGAEILGPVDVGEGESRVVVRVPRAQGPALSHALGQLQRVRSSRKLDAVRIQVDPPTL